MFFVLSAPSGTGKTTIARSILQQCPWLTFSVSATTRPMRAGEVDGRDYHFHTVERFRALIDDGAFVEYEEVFGNLYGTPVAELERAERDGRHLLFDIDVKGALSIKRHAGARAVTIFIRPPDLETVRGRLERRGSDSPEVIARRLERAAWELEQAPLFDHVIVNDELTRAIRRVRTVIDGAIAHAAAAAAVPPAGSQAAPESQPDAPPHDRN